MNDVKKIFEMFSNVVTDIYNFLTSFIKEIDWKKSWEQLNKNNPEAATAIKSLCYLFGAIIIIAFGASFTKLFIGILMLAIIVVIIVTIVYCAKKFFSNIVKKS